MVSVRVDGNDILEREGGSPIQQWVSTVGVKRIQCICRGRMLYASVSSGRHNAWIVCGRKYGEESRKGSDGFLAMDKVVECDSYSPIH